MGIFFLEFYMVYSYEKTRNEIPIIFFSLNVKFDVP